jgi:hypothetical protein
MLSLDEESGIMENKLTCSHCGFDFLQLGKPVTHYVGDEYDRSNPRGTRGNWIEVPCECEGCKKITTINISFHKGQVFCNIYPKIATVVGEFKEISRSVKEYEE